MPAMPYAQSSGASRTHVSWTDNHQQVLCYLIDKLSSPPILGYPDFNEPFNLHTDASQAGLGAVLYQRSHGKLRVIAYGSRMLTPPEKMYHRHSGKLEFLALKWASETIFFTLPRFSSIPITIHSHMF